MIARMVTRLAGPVRGLFQVRPRLAASPGDPGGVLKLRELARVLHLRMGS